MYVHVLCALSKPVLITESGNEIVCFPPYQWVKPHPLLKIYRLGQDKTVFIFPHRFLRDTLCLKAAPKVMPPVLLCWSMTSEVDVGGMAVEDEPSHQHSITFCCHVTDGSRGAAWHTQQHLTWKHTWSKGVSLNSSMWKISYPLTFTDTCWTFMWSHPLREQCMWAQWGGGWCYSSGNRGQPLLVQNFTSAVCTEKKKTVNSGDYAEKQGFVAETVVLNSVVVFFVSVVVSMEINQRRYFQSNPHE